MTGRIGRPWTTLWSGGRRGAESPGRRIVVWVAALVLAASWRPVARGEVNAQQSRALAASSVDLDLDPATGVILVWTEDGSSRREAAGLMAQSNAYRITRRYVTNIMGCTATDEEIARAFAVPDSGACGFSLKVVYDRRADVESLLASLTVDRQIIRERIAQRAGTYLPQIPRSNVVRVLFVLASQSMFDAATMDGAGPVDSTAVVLVNLSEVLGYGESLASRRAALEHVLAHEVFHAGIRTSAPSLEGWKDFPWSAHDPIGYIARVMLEEGVAHYIDWKDRDGSDSLFTPMPGPRERFAFTQLTRACKHLTGVARSPAYLDEILQLAATGPLWSKYGAISGMFAAYRIERVRGAEGLRSVVEAGPLAFLRAYEEVAAADTSALALPEQLIRSK